MLARTGRFTGIGAILLISLLVASCTVTPAGPGTPASVSLTLLGRTVTITFGPVGRVQAEKDRTVTQAGVVRLFDQTPSTRPPTGTMRLLGSSVSAGGPISGKIAARSQTGNPVSGTASVRFFVAPGESATACTTGTLLASYELSVVAGIISVLDDVANLSDAALDAVMVNDVTICIEVTANFSGLIIFDQFSFSFGGGSGAGGGAGTASFTMVNNDFENIHILLPGEEFNGALNRTTPGNTRNVTIDVEIGDVITLRAGRDGVVLSSVTCPTVTGSNYTATATWDGIEVDCEAEQSDDGGGGSTPPAGSSLQVPIDSPDGVAVAVPSTDTYNGIDFAIVGVLGDNTLGTPVSPDPPFVTIDLASLGLASVERMHMAVVSAFVPDLPNGVTLATLTCTYAEGGSPTTMAFTLGSTTAEWSFLRPEHSSIGGVAHDSITVLYSFPTTVDSAFEYDGWVYDVSLAMDSSRTLSSCTMIAASAGTFPPRTLVPEPTWAATSILGLTLVGPAGTPGDGGGGVFCNGQADCAPDEICTPDGVCIPGDFGGGGEGDVVQITTDPGNELDPQWDPASETIAFRTDRAPAGTSITNIGSVQADGSGEGNMAVGPNLPFGVGGPMFWVGTTGLLMVNERVVFHEYMTFDTSQAPFTRTVNDGDDEAFTRELLITGGGGGDFITVSRDGSTVLWRFSTNGGSGTAQLRTAPFSSLTGQVADTVGTVQFQDVDPVVQTLKNGAALNPSGSQVVVSLPSGNGSDLFLYDIADPAVLVRQLTSSGSSAGVNNAAPDISPDGTQVAFARTTPGEDTDLHLVGMDGTGLTQLTFTDRSESEPSWSPGGDRIAFQRGDDDGWNIYVLTLGDGVPVDECSSGADCSSGEICVGGVCVPDDDGTIPGEDCTSDGTCNAECGDTDPDCAEVCVADGFCNVNCSDLDPDPDCPAEPTGQPRCTMSSSFDSGDEGWLILGDAQGGRGDPDFVASGGNPGGHISAKDDAQGGVWFFQAPATYRGNFSGALGKTLTFDLKQSSLSSQFDFLDVSMTGGGLTIVVDAGPNPGTDWTSFSIVLDTSAGWMLDALGGTPATQAEILAVLTDLNDTRIRGEFVDGPDTGGLDNVVLNSDCAGVGGGGADCSSDGTCNAECGDTDPDCAFCGADGVCMGGCPGIDPDCGCENCPGECVDGVCFAQGDISFADVVLRYDPEAGGGPTPEAAFADPSQALGPPNFVKDFDGTFTSLSNGGVLELGFTDNVLTNSGDTQTDLRVFEVGALEATFVALRATSTTQGLLAAQNIFPSGDWFDIGAIGGSTRNIDIDQFFPGFGPGELEFDAVQLIDDPDQGLSSNLRTPGADIDAVGAIATRPA